jgi:hypothetical protein
VEDQSVNRSSHLLKGLGNDVCYCGHQSSFGMLSSESPVSFCYFFEFARISLPLSSLDTSCSIHFPSSSPILFILFLIIFPSMKLVVHKWVRYLLILYGCFCGIIFGICLGLSCTIFADFEKENDSLRWYGLFASIGLTLYLVYQWGDLFDNWDRYFELEDWREEEQHPALNGTHQFSRHWGRILMVPFVYSMLVLGSWRGWALHHGGEIEGKVTNRLLYGTYIIWAGYLVVFFAWTFSFIFIIVLRLMGTPPGKRTKRRIEAYFRGSSSTSSPSSSSSGGPDMVPLVGNDCSSSFQVSFIRDGILPSGRIGVCCTPGRVPGTSVTGMLEELLILKNEYKVDYIVNLTELSEMASDPTRSELLSKSSEVFGDSRVIHFPIRDNWIPTSLVKFSQMANTVAKLVEEEGKSVVVHCAGGKGRSALFAGACMLMIRKVGVFFFFFFFFFFLLFPFQTLHCFFNFSLSTSQRTTHLMELLRGFNK